MLYALELDILSESDREELEIHLLECDSCYEKAIQFEETIRHLRYDRQVQGEIESLASYGSVPSPVRHNRFFRLFPAVATVLILAILVAWPWNPEIGPGDELVAASNRMIVMYFDDLTAPDSNDDLGEIIATLLITDLGESRYVQVVSAQRLYDLMRSIELDPIQPISADEATELAERSGAQWMLTGAVVRRDPLLVTSQIAEIKSGDVVATQRIEGKPGDDVFGLVDRLTIQVKNDLALPSAALDEPDRHIADYTTTSKEAYNYYLQGLNYLENTYDHEARMAFQKAVDCDSTFAMGYYYLSLLGKPEMLSKAIRFIDNTSTPDRYRVRSHEALVLRDTTTAITYLRTAIERYPDEKDLLIQLAVLLSLKREYEESIIMAERALEIDPLSKGALNRLAYSALMDGRIDLAEKTADRYVQIDPNEANPYDTRGDILTAGNKLEEANESYRQALTIDANFAASRMHLIRNLILLGDYAQAEELIHDLQISDNPTLVAQGHLYGACLSIRKGELKKATQQLRETTAFDLENELVLNLAVKRFLLAELLSLQGNGDEAIRILESCPASIDSIQPNPGLAYRHIAAQYAAYAGDELQARQIAHQLEISSLPYMRYGAAYAYGAIALYSGDYDNAITLLTSADSMFSSSPVRYLLARAYLEAGDYEHAVSIYRELLRSTGYRQYLWAVRDIEAIYLSGLAYEGFGDYEHAAAAYESFLEFWGNASPPVPEADDARVRLARLHNRP